MIKPTKYKSVSVSSLKLRQASPITEEKKQQTFNVLTKLMNLIKLKHS